jgi:hypothetical protein
VTSRIQFNPAAYIRGVKSARIPCVCAEFGSRRWRCSSAAADIENQGQSGVEEEPCSSMGRSPEDLIHAVCRRTRVHGTSGVRINEATSGGFEGDESRATHRHRGQGISAIITLIEAATLTSVVLLTSSDRKLR